MATLKDVAREAGVSTATVSRVVCGKDMVTPGLKNKVEKALKKTGYRPNQTARALVNQRTSLLGLIVPDLSLSFYGTLAAGVLQTCKSKGYKVIVNNSFREPEAELDAIADLQEQGCQHILLHSLYGDESVLTELCQRIPGLVILNRFIPSLAEHCVSLDNVTGGRLIAQHVLEQGRRQIAVINSSSPLADPVERLRGIQQSCEAHGVELAANAVAYTEPSIEGGKQAIELLLNSQQVFDAVLAYNDNMALGAMNALLDKGYQVPKDIAVTGFDDLFFASTCRPGLTTMHYPIKEMAAYAAKLSFDLVNRRGDVKHKRHLFVPSLVSRGSVCCDWL
ncbi:DNA-binding transcriptional regulator GalS [Saccharobesus litoralis]|uniref:DNA-binding transcriptional regulator GalS n=1 Tax=Saccharobesus litoralis TaxID=2172099 RepID=A0A2S0VN44_9ALTE|nr:LacI family DNA-binding transcriptional regulator [Saccharobesus litoralis]AWB65643.1 DNA-binding transcriptional regulator GalS [Saccharobesus litoralis]